MADQIEKLRQELLRQAFLFDDQIAFRAGVERTLAAAARLLTPAEPVAPPGAGVA